MNSYQVSIGERVVRVQLRQEDDQTFMRIDDDDEQPVALSHVHATTYSLLLRGVSTELLADSRDNEVRIALAGVEYRADVVDEAHARLASVAGARAAGHVRRELRAPMPGLLVKVLCQPGEMIEAGKPLAVLQAMKMENELSLPRGGTVSQVNVREGQTVEQGQVLIVVE